MFCYFNEKSHKGRQGIFCIIASVLSDEYESVCLKSIKTKADYEAVVELAQDREQWKGISFFEGKIGEMVGERSLAIRDMFSYLPDYRIVLEHASSRHDQSCRRSDKVY